MNNQREIDMASAYSVEALKTFFVVRTKEDSSIARVVVASCNTNDFAACGRAIFATRQDLRSRFPAEKYAIETITASKFHLPITLDNSLIEHKVIP